MKKLYKEINNESWNKTNELNDYETFKNQLSFIGIAKRSGFLIESYTNYKYNYKYFYKNNKLEAVKIYYK